MYGAYGAGGLMNYFGELLFMLEVRISDDAPLGNHIISLYFAGNFCPDCGASMPGTITVS